MPETSFERVLAVGTFLAAVALVVMAATNREVFFGSRAAATGPPLVRQQAVRTDAPSRVPAPPATESAAFRRTEPNRVHSPPPKRVVLVITASRGPTWLEVRAGNSTGVQLYYGTLDQGATTEFARLPVWVRLGAAERVDMKLGTSVIESLPIADNGVVQFVASAKGVIPVSDG